MSYKTQDRCATRHKTAALQDKSRARGPRMGLLVPVFCLLSSLLLSSVLERSGLLSCIFS